MTKSTQSLCYRSRLDNSIRHSSRHWIFIAYPAIFFFFFYVHYSHQWPVTLQPCLTTSLSSTLRILWYKHIISPQPLKTWTLNKMCCVVMWCLKTQGAVNIFITRLVNEGGEIIINTLSLGNKLWAQWENLPANSHLWNKHGAAKWGLGTLLLSAVCVCVCVCVCVFVCGLHLCVVCTMSHFGTSSGLQNQLKVGQCI